MIIKKLFFLLTISVLLSCNSEINSFKELVQKMNVKENGLIKIKEANGFELIAKMLPPEYLAYSEMRKDDVFNEKVYLKYLHKFNESLTFLLIIKHEDNQIGVDNYGVNSFADYKKRVVDLSFNMKEHINLKLDDNQIIKPKLTTMENVYEVSSTKTIYMVFAEDEFRVSKAKKIDLIFNDIFLDTGINHFVFQNNAFQKNNKINFFK